MKKLNQINISSYMKIINLLYFSIFVFILSLLPASSAGCWPCEKGSGNIVKEKRELKKFNRVVLKGSGNVYIKQGSQSLEVETDDNIMKYIYTEVDGNSLIITIKGGVSICPKKLNFFLAVEDLAELDLKGSGNIGVKGPLESKSLKVRIDGSGDIVAKNITVGEMKVEINGSGDVKISGTAQIFKGLIRGSGDIEMSDCKVDQASVEIYGSGDVRVDVGRELSAKIYGSGDILYTGKPERLNKDIKGSGEVKRID